MSNRPHPTPEDLRAYALGKLPNDEFDSVASHLDQCVSCSDTINGLDLTEETLIEALRHKLPTKLENATQPFPPSIIERAASRVLQEEGEPAIEFGPYRLLEKIGVGGMGSVYRAEHTRLGREVAIKLLPTNKSNSPEWIARFTREMKAVGTLRHENVVQAFDAGEHDGQSYLSMELLDGLDLGAVVEEGGVLPVADACEVVRQAALGLAHAHSHGLVHRDIKPTNLLLSTDGVVKLLDLGLVGQSDERLPLPPSDQITQLGELTEGDHLLGTPSFMSPEQCSSSKVGPKSDLYSLGATLYYLLTARPPFSGHAYSSVSHKIEAIKTQSPPPITDRRPDLPASLAEIVRRLLVLSADERFDSAEQVAAALEPLARNANPRRLLPSTPPGERVALTRPRPRTPLIAVVVSLLCVIAILVATARNPTTGTLRIKAPAGATDSVSAELTSDGKTRVVNAQVGWSISLAQGDWQIRLTDASEEFTLDRETITIAAGEELIVQIKRRPSPKPIVSKAETPPPKAEPQRTAFDGPDPFRAEWDRQVDLYTGSKAYRLNEQGVLELPDLRWRVQDRYVGRNGQRTVIDERITLVLIDAPNGFWPVIAKLTLAEAERLDEQLKRLSRRRDRPDGPQTLSARLATQPYTVEQFGQIKLPRELRWEASTEKADATDAAYALVLKDLKHKSQPLEITLPFEQARQLRSDLAGAVKRKRASMKQRIALQTPNGLYLGARGGGGREVTAVDRRPGSSEVFTLEWVNAQRTQGQLRTRNGYYLRAADGVDDAIDARKKDPKTSGVFDFEWLDTNRSEARLRTSDGRYVRVVDGKVDAIPESPAEATPLRIVGAP